ncbi:MAG: manganese efflux pump MntP family protein [Clostridia bacterium]|nr:manganese efflux pump MntP family protein [Clostridia bacterium]
MLWTLILSVFLSGVSLSMDAFAVSICDGMIYQNLTKRKAVLIPLTFGVFQAVMPIIGFYISMAFRQIEVFDAVDHWIAFALLLIIGGKMIFDGIKDLIKKEEEELIPKDFSMPTVLVQGVATSIDALFVGFGLNVMLENAVQNVQLWAWISVAIIGVTTFIIALVGVFLGKTVGKLFKKKAYIAEIIGGVVLMLIAVKILLNGLGLLSF